MDQINETIGTLPAEQTLPGYLVASSTLFILAMIPIYFGSIRSTEKESDEHLSFKDAATFPLIASAALLGIFLAFKLLNAESIDCVVRIFFSITGTISISRFLAPYLHSLYPSSFKNYDFKARLSFKESSTQETSSDDESEIHIQAKDAPGILVGLIIGSFYFMNRVFGTPVMVTVATKFDAPIKIAFPRDLFQTGIFTKQLSMLGLGDIVIPGIFVALFLRIDRYYKRKSNTYFWAAFIAYALGLLTTFYVMHLFRRAQPALLYLVPSCLVIPLGLALVKGDLSTMFDYADKPDEEEDVKKDSNQSTESSDSKVKRS